MRTDTEADGHRRTEGLGQCQDFGQRQGDSAWPGADSLRQPAAERGRRFDSQAAEGVSCAVGGDHHLPSRGRRWLHRRTSNVPERPDCLLILDD